MWTERWYLGRINRVCLCLWWVMVWEKRTLGVRSRVELLHVKTAAAVRKLHERTE